MVNTEVKGTLAKLLATENLNIEHRSVSTAYFDVEKRVLCLPIWNDVSSTVYDLLVGHEVGHALYTPLDYVEESAGVPQDILNVLEDVRIEKMMKKTYPGLVKSFFSGYNELNDKNFFELEGKDISKMAFIDRLNIYYKVGVVVDKMHVSFESDERPFVERAGQTKTFEDVVYLAQDIMMFLETKKKEEVEAPAPAPAASSDSDEVQVGPTTNVPQSQSSSTDTNGETEDGGSDNAESEQETSGSMGADESVSQTQKAMERNQQKLVDPNAQDYVYVDLPDFNLQEYIVPFKSIVNEFDLYYQNGVRESDKHYVENQRARYVKYKRESIKTVNYLVKEFECKKAATQYSRSSVSKTGVLDTQKLHTYKFSDDIFKKVTNLPDGKNHGLVFYLDWSGSMSSTMNGTMRQLFDLVWFCKKVAIPFRVYAFSNATTNDNFFPIEEKELIDGQLSIDGSFRLLELISSKMNTATMDKVMRDLYLYSIGNFGPHSLPLSGTPLVEAIISVPNVVKQFRREENVEKPNVVFLTDGEAAYPQFNKYIAYLNRIHSQPMAGWGPKIIVRDPKTKYQNEVMLDYITNNFIKYISNLVDCNIIGFRLCSRSEIRTQAHYLHFDFSQVERLEKEWKKSKCVAIANCGFQELYLMQVGTQEYEVNRYWTPSKETDTSINVGENATKGQLTNAFKKHMNAKMINKTILSKFVGQIA